MSGTASGVGKTTIALAIMAGLRRRGLAVQPFKSGPDFLDTGHHTRVCGRKARNLDTWMLSEEANREVLRDAARGADVVVAEGMMGLFDGKCGNTEAGSTAEIAKLLKLPAVLVVDAAKTARSIAAVVLGFELFDPQLQLAGVILNRVATERHYEMLRAAIETSCKTKILGWMPRDPSIAIPERHLGLQGAAEAGEDDEAAIDTLAALAEKYLDLDRMLDLQCGLEMTRTRDAGFDQTQPVERVRIGVPSDHAFSFYYEDNLDLLRQEGAEIVPFSPLHDKRLPDGLDALYLGGGYPELHAERLSSNRQMLEDVRAFTLSGRPVYAECGGMIYLSESLSTVDGVSYPMAGVLPLSMKMTGRLVQFGYVTVEFTEDCLLGQKGTAVRGHSFHYSCIVTRGEVATNYRVQYSMSGKEEREGFGQGSVLASYVHLHLRANPAIARTFLTAVRRARTLQTVTT
ncbi:cobyrinate a,c-diamide synthase [Granulicella sp. S190]|uniref:cobyrinate a,c-diamide synthase n=1 Tax=Granulicella sp. S190 TaxID=1747226 RepID=UPI0020B144A3|nr:cobyrinate a,c-diamide synthase [Granulicella sp. S190]